MYFNSKLQTTWFSFQSKSTQVQSPFPSLSAMLLYTAGRVLLGIPSVADLHAVKTGLLNDSLDVLLELGEKKKDQMKRYLVNKEFVPVWQCSSHPGTARYSVHLVPLLFRHSQIFDDDLPNTVLFHVRLAYDHSNSQPSVLLELGEKKKGQIKRYQVNKEFVPVWQCSSHLGTARYSVHLVPLLFRHSQIFDDDLPNTVLFHVRLAYDHSNSQPSVLLEPGEKKKGQMKRYQVNKEFVPVWRCSSHPGTARYSVHLVLLLFRHSQIFDDDLPNTVLFHVRLAYDHSNSQPSVLLELGEKKKVKWNDIRGIRSLFQYGDVPLDQELLYHGHIHEYAKCTWDVHYIYT